MSDVLTFGIPTLDGLFGAARGIEVSPANNNSATTTSVCLVGPTGVGKSIMALHFAAQYARRRNADAKQAHVWYASTDLGFDKANAIWRAFALGDRGRAPTPFEDSPRPLEKSQSFNLVPTVPEPGAATEVELLINQKSKDVIFLDLNASTTGDLWDYLYRILVALEPEKADHPNLLVIDAVEGLEVLAGELDVFGERRTRRSRITQLLRTARDHTHVLLVEEVSRRSRGSSPEQYLADTVVRLRRRLSSHGYSRRTLEILKARAQSHVRGEHAFVIRDGKGSPPTGSGYADDPQHFTLAIKTNDTSQAGKPQAYGSFE